VLFEYARHEEVPVQLTKLGVWRVGKGEIAVQLRSWRDVDVLVDGPDLVDAQAVLSCVEATTKRPTKRLTERVAKAFLK
jgi:hypothetical protein